MRRAILAVVCAILLAGTLSGHGQRPASPADDFVRPGEVEPLSPPLAAAVAGLRAPSLAAHIAFLASASLEGRGLGARGLETAAEYVAATFALAGIPPLAPPAAGLPTAAYFHPVPVREIRGPSGELRVEIRRGDTRDVRTFRAGVDCLFPERPPEAFGAPVVFAGYGIREVNPARDDYRDLDVAGKVVLIFGGVPAGKEWQAPALLERYGAEAVKERFARKAEIAGTLGARAVLAIEDDGLSARLTAAGTPPTFFAPLRGARGEAPPVVQVSEGVGEALLASANLSVGAARAERGRLLPGATVEVRLTGDERLVAGRNVVGVIRGADPSLRDEAVILGAHMDHLGRRGDTIYPGADDNASGVSALLEIAKAFASSPHKPRRTLVFVGWTGEEEGHLGSEYYVDHPLWPLQKTAVYLNLDMIGHPWTPEEIRQLVADSHLDHADEFLATVKTPDFLELGVADSAPALGAVLKTAARGTGVALHLDWTDGKSGGSDYRAFARHGVPFVRFFGDFFDGYHQPTDTADKLDAGQVLRMARLAFASAWLLGDQALPLRQ
jgi:hypothetical protein